MEPEAKRHKAGASEHEQAAAAAAATAARQEHKQEQEHKQDEQDEEQLKLQKQKQQQLAEWRENAKHLYERLDTITLAWPSLTAQWAFGGTDSANGSSHDSGKDAAATDVEHALVATYTLGAEPEAVREVAVATERLRPHEHEVRSWRVPPPAAAALDAGRTAEAQKLRQSPCDPSRFAVFTAHCGDVFVYTKEGSAAEPVQTLRGGHAAGGFGLAWSPRDANVLASGADDGKVVVWDVARGVPRAELATGAAVNEVTWDHADSLVAALEDGRVLVLSPELAVRADLACHAAGVNSAALSPFAPHLLATGAADRRFKLWDTRRPGAGALYENFAHEGTLNCVRWSPHVDGVLATAGMDGVVFLWDIRTIGKDQPHEEAEDGAAELLFKHNGHLNGDQVQDIDWHPTQELLLLSTDGRNVLMSWRPSSDALAKPRAPRMPSFLL